MTKDKIKAILDKINSLEEDLLALPDDMLLNIDPRDNESLEEGTAFIKNFNENLTRLTKYSSKIRNQIKNYFDVNPEEEDLEKESTETKRKDRIIKELDKKKPHYLEENFTYKRPYGFVLNKTATKGIKTWRSMYMQILQLLGKEDSDKFNNLLNNENFITNQGHSYFSSDESELRQPAQYKDGFYAEVNLSANQITEQIENLLKHFNIEPEEMKIYLREDRDADKIFKKES